MSIRIINLHKKVKLKENEILIKVDRSSPLGNPFIMYNESDREKVCDDYETYFYLILNKYMSYTINYLTDKEKMFINELKSIYKLYIKKKDIAFGCWCSPKKCHAETIKNFLEGLIC